jgi:hypothetical protein
MNESRLPTIEEVEKIDLDVVMLSFKSEEQLRFRVLDPTTYPEYRPFDIVFTGPLSFTGSDDLWDVHLCPRGPSPTGDGLVFEFESREVVPTEGRPYQVQVTDAQDPQVLFGKTVRDVKARIVAAGVTVEDAVPSQNDARSSDSR